MIPSDDPLMALAMLSGRADSTIEAGFMGHALGVTEDQAREACDALVADGLAHERGRGYKLTELGRERTREEYERRIAPVDEMRRAMVDEEG